MPARSTPRPQCSAFVATSVDGYLARPDGAIDFLAVAEAAGEDYGYGAFFASVDVVVLGRRTYDTVLGFDAWPYGATRCVVLTHRPPVARHGEQFFDGAVAELVGRLAREGARRVYVDGGEVIGQFVKAGLLDDLTLSIVPVVLGAGRRLFAGGEPEGRLTLEDCRSWPTGVVQVRYRAAAVPGQRASP